MRFQFFHIPATNPGKQVEELNRFLTQHCILNVQREFVSDRENSYWSLCVSFTANDSPPASAPGKRGIDYREVLNEEDFAVYARLRDLRRDLAEKENVPAFAVFNNERMANMVRSRVKSAAALQKISGVGAAKVKKYGDAFLEILCDTYTADTNNNESADREAEQHHD